MDTITKILAWILVGILLALGWRIGNDLYDWAAPKVKGAVGDRLEKAKKSQEDAA